MPLTDVQWVLGHAHLSTTQRYLNPVTEDVIAERAGLPRPAGATAARCAAGAGIPGREPADPVRRGRAVTVGEPAGGSAGAGRRGCASAAGW